MALVLAIAVAGPALVPAKLSERAGHRMLADYPDWALREARSAQVWVEYVVDPEGKPLECRPTVLVGYDRLGPEVCHGLARSLERATVDGLPAYGYGTFGMLLVVGQNSEALQVRKARPMHDLVITLQAVPAAWAKPVAAIVLLVDAAGHATACNGTNTDAAMAAFACAQVAPMAFPVIAGRDGQPVAYVRQMSIVFEDGAAAGD